MIILFLSFLKKILVTQFGIKCTQVYTKAKECLIPSSIVLLYFDQENLGQTKSPNLLEWNLSKAFWKMLSYNFEKLLQDKLSW